MPDIRNVSYDLRMKLNPDPAVAMNIVDIIFGLIQKRLQAKNISLFWKNIMLSAIPKTLYDVKQDITDMSDEQIKALLDSIQRELNKREK